MHRVRVSDLAARLWRRSGVSGIHRRSIAGRDPLVYGPDVAAARKHGLPIVALESTIITHGMPYPDNFNTALRVEDAIRKQVCTVPDDVSFLPSLPGSRVTYKKDHPCFRAIEKSSR